MPSAAHGWYSGSSTTDSDFTCQQWDSGLESVFCHSNNMAYESVDLKRLPSIHLVRSCYGICFSFRLLVVYSVGDGMSVLQQISDIYLCET